MLKTPRAVQRELLVFVCKDYFYSLVRSGCIRYEWVLMIQVLVLGVKARELAVTSYQVLCSTY